MAVTLVIFGASGDLTSRKLIPALYQLSRKGRLPENTQIVGFSRTKFSDEDWRKSLAETTAKYLKSDFETAAWQKFAEHVHYQPGDISQQDDFEALHARLHELERRSSGKPSDLTRVYYLATASQFYEEAIERLGASGLADEENGPRRVVIEKPFGRDLKTARELNQAVHRVFREQQVYRIDHYLGKETVLNLLVLRFANAIFEPLLNRNHVARVEITTSETAGMEGRRGPYYEQAGALRDMVQNHMLQLLTLLAMEVPSSLSAQAIRDEKVKVLRSIPPLTPEQVARFTARGQYIGGEGSPAYTAESGVAPDSQMETFAAVRLTVDNWRWAGVPFYLRTGKRLAQKVSQIVVVFHPEPVSLFYDAHCPIRLPNRLVLRVAPDEGVSLTVDGKVPGAGMMLRPVNMDFRYESAFGSASPEAYEHLLLEAVCGDATLFIRRDEVEAAWRIVDSIRNSWNVTGLPTLEKYPPRSWGPPSASRLFEDPYGGWLTIR